MAPRSRTLIVAVVGLAASGCAVLERSSVSSAPANQAGTAASTEPSISQSGRYVAFTSLADDLVPGDTNGVSDVFVRDNVTETTERISVSTDEEPGNGPSTAPSISDNGRYVAFASRATNLDGDPDGANTDIFVRDRATGTTTIASLRDDESHYQAFAGPPTISGDGTTVAFPLNLQWNDSPMFSLTGPFVRHLDTASTTELAPPQPLGGGSIIPGPYALSDDGHRVSSVSFAVSPTTSRGQAIVHDTTSGEKLLTRPAVNAAGWPPGFTISGDGKWWAQGFASPGMAPTPGIILVGKIDDSTFTPIEVAASSPASLSLSDDGSVLGAQVRTFFGEVAMVSSPLGAAWELVSENAVGNVPVVVTATDFSGDGHWFAYASSDPSGVPGDAHGVSQVYTRTVATPSNETPS